MICPCCGREIPEQEACPLCGGNTEFASFMEFAPSEVPGLGRPAVPAQPQIPVPPQVPVPPRIPEDGRRPGGPPWKWVLIHALIAVTAVALCFVIVSGYYRAAEKTAAEQQTEAPAETSAAEEAESPSEDGATEKTPAGDGGENAGG